jgi:hypothetical protein
VIPKPVIDAAACSVAGPEAEEGGLLIEVEFEEVSGC